MTCIKFRDIKIRDGTQLISMKHLYFSLGRRIVIMSVLK